MTFDVFSSCNILYNDSFLIYADSCCRGGSREKSDQGSTKSFWALLYGCGKGPAGPTFIIDLKFDILDLSEEQSSTLFYGGPFWSKLLYLIFGRCRVILVLPSNYLCSGFQFLTTFLSFLPCLIIIFGVSELFLCKIYFLHVLIIFVYKLFFVHV